MNPVTEHKATRKVLKVLHGTRSATPTLAIPNFLPFGLLYFLNEKQSQMQRVLYKDHSDVQLYGNPNTSALLSGIEFINFIVGGLIVEAERVDEMCIQLKKQIIVLDNQIQCGEMDVKLTRRSLSSGVQQTLATHYNQPMISRVHHASQPDCASQQLQPLNSELGENKVKVQRLRQHLKVSLKVQRILHGAKDAKSLHALPQENASDLIADMSVLLSFRKAQHFVRDAVYDVKTHEGSGLAAISSLTEFLDYVDWGMSAALDELEASELRLRKMVKISSTEHILGELDRRDVDNKQMSCAALRYNQSVNSPRAASVSVRVPMPGWTPPPTSFDRPKVAFPPTYDASHHNTPAMTNATTATPNTAAYASGGFVYTPPTFLSNPRQPQDLRQPLRDGGTVPDAFLDAVCS